MKKEDLRKVLTLIRKGGPLSIRDIDDDVLVEKDHAWASRKPSKRALQLAFYGGVLTISERSGMLKTYELMDRHFGWNRRPKPATERQVLDYLLDRALRSQGLVSLDSVCHLDARRKPAIRRLIETRRATGGYCVGDGRRGGEDRALGRASNARSDRSSRRRPLSISSRLSIR